MGSERELRVWLSLDQEGDGQKGGGKGGLGISEAVFHLNPARLEVVAQGLKVTLGLNFIASVAVAKEPF